MRSLLLITSVASGLVLPVAVVCAVIISLVFDASFYHEGQTRYQVWRTTGLSTITMDQVNRGIVRFFGNSESLPAALRQEGAPPDIFSEREILHMVDVRTLIRGIETLGKVALGYTVGFAVLAAAFWRQGGREALARAMILSSMVILVTGGLAATVTYFGFDSLFLWFHQVSFQNDFWQLDPRTDHLIQMFPFGFWFDAMLVVTFRVLLVVIVLGGGGFLLRRRSPRADHRNAHRGDVLQPRA